MNKDIINKAIENKQVVEFYYDDKQRIVEPYAIGKTSKNKLSLLSIQIGGYSSSSNLPDWRMFEVNKITGIKVHKRKFAAYFQIYQDEARNIAQPLYPVISKALDIDEKLLTDLQNDFNASIRYIEGISYWLARDLRRLLGYGRWSSLAKIINQLGLAAKNAGYEQGADLQDALLTAEDCLKITKTASFKKLTVRFALIYFANEVNKDIASREEHVEGLEHIKARMRLSETERYLSSALYEHGADDKNLGRIRSAGDSKLFGGLSTARIKEKLGIKNRALSDFLPDILIRAKEFAATLTSYNICAHNINDTDRMRREHVNNNSLVRYALSKAGIVPEAILFGNHAQKLEAPKPNDDEVTTRIT